MVSLAIMPLFEGSRCQYMYTKLNESGELVKINLIKKSNWWAKRGR